GAYWLGAVFERDRQKVFLLTKVALFCLAVSLLNPNGWKLHQQIVEFMHSGFMMNWVAEYASPNFHQPVLRGFLVWLGLMFFTLALRRPKLPSSGVVMVMGWTYLALYAVRNIPVMVLLTAPVIAPALSEAVRGKWREFSQRAA